MLEPRKFKIAVEVRKVETIKKIFYAILFALLLTVLSMLVIMPILALFFDDLVAIILACTFVILAVLFYGILTRKK